MESVRGARFQAMAVKFDEKHRESISDLEAKVDDLARENRILKDRWSKVFETDAPSIAKVATVVSEFYRVSVSDMRSERRTKVVTMARHIAMFLAYEFTSRGYPTIGRFFDRDHTSVMHAIEKIKRRRVSDIRLNAELLDLSQTIRSIDYKDAQA